MVKEPVETAERNFTIHFFIDFQGAADGFVVGGVQAERPTIFDQVADDRLEFVFHHGRHLRPRLEEVFEIGGREDEHLARAVHPIEVVAFTRPRHPRPALEVRQLLPGLLREQVRGEADGQFAAPVQFFDDFVVVRIVLKTAARVDDAGDAEAVEFAHELARRVHLVRGREFRPFGERGIQNHGVRAGDEQPRRIPLLISLNLPAGRVGRVFRVPDGAQGRVVQPGAVVEVQDEHGRVGSRGIDLLQRRHAALGELELRPAADHPDPLRRRGPRRLLLQQAQRVRQ